MSACLYLMHLLKMYMDTATTNMTSINKATAGTAMVMIVLELNSSSPDTLIPPKTQECIHYH